MILFPHEFLYVFKFCGFFFSPFQLSNITAIIKQLDLRNDKTSLPLMSFLPGKLTTHCYLFFGW